MSKQNSSLENELMKAPVSKLLLKLSLPSTVGMMALTICQITDTVFIGRFIGLQGLGAIAILIPIILIFSSFGRGLGVGGASIISRAIGKGQVDLACLTLYTVIGLWIGISFFFLVCAFIFSDNILFFLTEKSELAYLSSRYYMSLLPGLPFLGFAMLSNSIIRSIGKASQAMWVMLIPAILNIILDPLFIICFKWGMVGAGVATSLSYLGSACFCLWYFLFGNNHLKLTLNLNKPPMPLLKEVLSIGITPIVCQSLTTIAVFIVNNTLFSLGGDIAIASYSLVQRIYVFALFPLIGISQGFIPICGYNHGRGDSLRIKELITVSVRYILITALIVTGGVMLLNEQFVSLFTMNKVLIKQSAYAINATIILLPLVAIQLIFSVYFQTLGFAFRFMLTTVLQQGLLLIPFVMLLSHYFGINGVWYAYPLANLMAFIISLVMITPEWHHIFKSENVRTILKMT